MTRGVFEYLYSYTSVSSSPQASLTPRSRSRRIRRAEKYALETPHPRLEVTQKAYQNALEDVVWSVRYRL